MNIYNTALLAVLSVLAFNGCKRNPGPIVTINEIENNHSVHLTVHRIPDLPLYCRVGCDLASVARKIEKPCDIKVICNQYGFRVDVKNSDNSKSQHGPEGSFTTEQWKHPNGPPAISVPGDNKIITVLFNEVFCNDNGEPVLSFHLFQQREKSKTVTQEINKDSL